MIRASPTGSPEGRSSSSSPSSAPHLPALLVLLPLLAWAADPASRPRIRDLGSAPGIFQPGPLNAITDVEGVRVGHRTLVRGDSVRTGVTAILSHGGNLFQSKAPAAVYVGNGFGKAAGFLQVQELGNRETPIVLTNTLSVAPSSTGPVLAAAMAARTSSAVVLVSRVACLAEGIAEADGRLREHHGGGSSPERLIQLIGPHQMARPGHRA